MNAFFTGKDTERNFGRIVRIMVVVAAVLTLSGGIVYLVHNGHALPRYSSFRGEPFGLQNIGEMIGGAGGVFQALDLIRLGILILIAVPILRVSLFLVAFLLKKDYVFSAISFIVLVILFVAFFHGKV